MIYTLTSTTGQSALGKGRFTCRKHGGCEIEIFKEVVSLVTGGV